MYVEIYDGFFCAILYVGTVLYFYPRALSREKMECDVIKSNRTLENIFEAPGKSRTQVRHLFHYNHLLEVRYGLLRLRLGQESLRFTMVEKYLVALAVGGLVDAVSYMVVAPSIIFYVVQQGGTKEQYGIILSAFSFASFCAKPFLGAWSDRAGFRIPYICSLALSACGGLFYLLASVTKIPVGMILAGRLLGGVGAASSALGFAYLANVVANDQQTKVNSLLSAIRMVGMAVGPGVNVVLASIDLHVGSFSLDPLNSVGLVLLVSNILALASIYFLLDDPPREEPTKTNNGSSLWSLVTSMLCAEIVVPILCIFGFNASFQLIETGFAPAASHALGWGPVEASAVLGCISIVIFAAMFLVLYLSSRKVKDESLMTFGLWLSIVGYTLIYVLWCMGAPAWHFYAPMVLSASSFPFLGAPTRSVFTKAVETKPVLAKHGGTMQAILSMFASVAGFVTPGVVAAYVLRHPTQVEHSRNHRELTPLALFAPGTSLLTFVGLLYITWKHGLHPVDEKVGMADEMTYLKEPSCQRRFSCQIEAQRRQSACLMGFPQSSMLDEYEGESTREVDLGRG